MKKKVDARIRTLIENGVKTGHRSLFVMVGDKGKNQVVNIHYLLSKCRIQARPSVLWCYKRDLGFSSSRKKRARAIKNEVRRGLRTVDEEDPFELFVMCTKIRYCYYKETHKILGQTFGMLILQDFEAITPNILCRTIETIEGGGIVVLMIKTLKNLRQLYQISMDVHKRFRTASSGDVVARFNERFILSLSDCHTSIVIDDELNILPVSSHVHSLEAVTHKIEKTEAETELASLKNELAEDPPVGGLIRICKTLDQAKALLEFLNAVADKQLSATVSMTASRGRGKSAALGVAIAGAIAYGYSNIFVTSPSPENLGTCFEFIFKGFDVLDYKEHMDYEIIQSSDPDLKGAVIRVNVFKDHRQTIQYIDPQNHQALAQAELLVIDECAAIPLPHVTKLLGPYIVFMSSTIHGYEGTGRSLSLKLLRKLREQSRGAAGKEGKRSRLLKEVTLEEPIRYKEGDQVEKWMNDLLCLDCVGKLHRIVYGTPAPLDCELFYVNRDTLFSYHKASEAFLQRMMSLFVSSHYKNSPNDLLLLSDAPGHHLFVLVGPIKPDTTLPDILVVIQVTLEGSMNKKEVMHQLVRGHRPSGDLIPWTLSQQFSSDFSELSGVRIVRIATHPDVQRLGYGKRALQLLIKYYSGEICDVETDKAVETPASKPEDPEGDLTTEKIMVRTDLEPLLIELAKRPPEHVDYIGVSYGLTMPLWKFWKLSGFASVYIRQTANATTGEHTLIMLNPLNETSKELVDMFTMEFRQRFISLLGFAPFRDFLSILAISVLDPNPAILNSSRDKVVGRPAKVLKAAELRQFLTDLDLKRLEKYSKNLVDFHLIMDIVPMLASLFLQGRCKTSMSYSQCTLLLGVGLQRKNIDQVRGELKLTSAQTLALFNKAVRKLVNWYRKLEVAEIETQMKLEQAEAKAKEISKPLAEDFSKELSAAGKDQWRKRKAKLEAQMQDDDVESHLARSRKRKHIPNTISLPVAEGEEPEKEKRRRDSFSEGFDKKKKKKRRKHSV